MQPNILLARHYICISTSIDTYMPIWHNIIRAYFQLFSSLKKVAYGLLRVEIEELEVEHAGGLPPGLLRPASIEPLDL